jgi:hypothetical protein
MLVINQNFSVSLQFLLRNVVTVLSQSISTNFGKWSYWYTLSNFEPIFSANAKVQITYIPARLYLDWVCHNDSI